MASLAELYGTAKAKARQIPANLRESGKGLASWAVDPYGEAQRVMGEYRTMTPEQRQGLVNAAVDLFGGVDVGPVGAIKASHGGPHLFDRFDFSKIGTGEGAQAYGHGGYFAQGFDSPVAVHYQQMLAGKKGLQPKIGGKSIGQLYNEIERKANKLAPEKADIEYNKLQFLEDLDQNSVFKHAFDRIEDENIKPWAESLQSQYEPGGHLYNVELKWPDAAREAADPLGEHHLLDWDAPLSQQPEHIRQALTQYAKNAKPFDIPIGHDPTGAELYGMISAPRSVGAYKTSEDVQSLGIPGIRYLNQSSRGYSDVFNVGAPVDDFGPYTPYYTQAAANEALKELQKYFPNAEIRKQNNPQTRNYVMFDDRFPNIVTRNGVSITDLLKNR